MDFVRQGKPGPRGRTDHRITAAGEKLLKTGWRDLIERGSRFGLGPASLLAETLPNG